MGELMLDPALRKMRGKIGNYVFKKVRKTTYIAKPAELKKNMPVTEAQQAVRNRFKLAAIYAKSVVADPAAKAEYAAIAAHRAKPIFATIMADYFNPPLIQVVDLDHYSGLAGQQISITAFDDFEAHTVEVEISTADDGVVESGPAVQSGINPAVWTYTATAAAAGGGQISVKVTATDRPGNKTTKVVTK